MRQLTTGHTTKVALLRPSGGFVSISAIIWSVLPRPISSHSRPPFGVAGFRECEEFVISLK